MNKMIFTITTASALLASSLAFANVDNVKDAPPDMEPSRHTIMLEDAPFDSLNPSTITAGNDYYNQKVLTFTKWKSDFPGDSEALNLFPGYKERNFIDKNNKPAVEELMIFEARAKLLVTKRASNIDLSSMIKLDFINQMDPNISNQVVDGDNIITKIVANHGTVNNFAWCNKKGKFIRGPMRETDLSQNVDPEHAWCADKSRSVCLESCYIYTPGTRWALKNVVNVIANPAKDLGQATASEIRYFTNEKELSLRTSLASLTHINTPVRGGLVQSMFYSNQLAKFSKVIAVLQDHPTNPEASILTVLFVAGIKRHTWDENYKAVSGDQLLMGTASLVDYSLNTNACVITDGLPHFTQCTVSRIADQMGK